MLLRDLASVCTCLAASAAVFLANDSARAATLTQSVFKEVLFAQDLFSEFGRDDTLPQRFDAAADVGYASASGYVLTQGGAAPRAEGSMTFTALGNPASGLFAEFDARVYYEWTIEQVGGDPFVGPVPVDVHTSGAVERSANVWGRVQHLWAQANIDLPGTGLPSNYHAAIACVSFDCSRSPLSFDDRFTGWAEPGSVYTVILTAKGNGYLQADTGTFTISAWVDPRIEISAGFARREDFQVVFSAGVTPVPEPASFVLLSAGMVLVGGLARRSRRRSHVAS